MTATPPVDPPGPDPTQPGWAVPAPGPLPPGAPPTASPTDSWAPPPTPPKRKLTWLWVLLGALGLIAVLVVIGVVLFIRSIHGPIDATNDVLRAVKAGDYATAYRRACSADRQRFTADEFAQAFRDATAQRGRIKSYDVNYSQVSGDRADVAFDMDFARRGTDRFKATARKEHGRWRACVLGG